MVIKNLAKQLNFYFASARCTENIVTIHIFVYKIRATFDLDLKCLSTKFVWINAMGQNHLYLLDYLLLALYFIFINIINFNFSLTNN